MMPKATSQNDKLTVLKYSFRISWQKVMRFFTFILLVFWNTLSLAETLPAKEVFKATIVSVDEARIHIQIDILPGHYLYRDRLFDVQSNVVVKAIEKSAGIDKNDHFFGNQKIWYGGQNTADIKLLYDNPDKEQQAIIDLKYQGCQDGVLCYPPQTARLVAEMPDTGLLSTQKRSGLLSNKTTGGNVLNLGSQTKNRALSPEEAFPFRVDPVDETTLALHFDIAENHYLYRDKFKISAVGHESTIADIRLGSGQTHQDEFFGEQSIFRGSGVIGNIYLKKPVEGLMLNLVFQGCADRGICYPIMKHTVTVQDDETAIHQENPQTKVPIVDKLSDTLLHNLWAGIGLLLIAGIALSFTPCVLPMLPILLGVITNQRQVSKPRSAMLATAYALGIAVMMAVFGLVVAKTKINIQIIFQQPLWLVIFAGLFIALGLSMLGVFNIAMPNGIQSRVIAWQNRFKETSLSSVFIVGALSTLIVGPCVAPPLIAVLAFISTTGDSLLGAIYLFSLGLGMGLPLIIFASLATTIPRTGALSKLVTRIFSMLMFGVGLWLLSRLIPGSLSLVLWGAFMLVMAVFVWRSNFVQKMARNIAFAVSLAFVLVGSAWIAGGVMGNSNPLEPFTRVVKLPFEGIVDSMSFHGAITSSDKPVLVDLYADWCVSCQEVEHFTLTDPRVVKALADYTLLKLDITKTTDAHRQLLTELNLIGPPALLFFADGKEKGHLRNIGLINAEELLQKLAVAKEK